MEYDVTRWTSGRSFRRGKNGASSGTVYKTLVTIAGPRELFVFLVPVAAELDLKKAARAAEVKKLDMLPLKDLTKETGYVRGGCSAVGMKKNYPTFIDKSAEQSRIDDCQCGKTGITNEANSGLSSLRVTEALSIDIVKS